MAADSDDRSGLLRDGTNFHLHKSCLHIMQFVSVTLCMTFAKDNFGSSLISTSADAAGGVQPAEDHSSGS